MQLALLYCNYYSSKFIVLCFKKEELGSLFLKMGTSVVTRVDILYEEPCLNVVKD